MRLRAMTARLLQGFVLLCSLALFAWVAAHWILRVSEPAWAPPVAATDTDWSARILAGGALGFVRSDPAGAAQPAPAVAGIDGRIRLLGIARETEDRRRKDGQALFKIDNKRILWLRVGEELDTGIVLAAVDRDGVRLLRGGVETRLPLRERTRAATPAPAAAPVAAAVKSAPPAGGCKLTPEQRARAYVLRPEIVDGVMRERSGWNDLFRPVAEGLLVQNPGGTGAMLGLYGNDLLSKADGARLSGPEDVLRLVLQPLARNESVIVAGVRAGQPREWIYAGMSCMAR